MSFPRFCRLIFMRISMFPVVKSTPTPTPLWIIGFLAALAFALTNIYFKDVSRIAEPILALLGLICVFRYGAGLGRSPLFYFLWAALAIQLLSWTGSQFFHPELAEDYPKLDRLARLFLFLPLAWWLGGQLKNVFLFWSVAALGLLVSPWLLGFGYEQFAQGFQGMRIALDIRNAQHTAVLYGSLLIGLLVFSPRAIRTIKPWGALCWFLALAVTLAVVIFTQTRAVWSGLIVVLLTVTIGVLVFCFKNRDKGSAQALLVSTLILTGILGLTMYQLAPPRMFAEQSSLEKLFDGEFNEIPYSSIGTRIHSWRAGLELAADRPIIGWGGNARSYALAQTDWIPSDKAERYQHLHNSYLELVLQYGLIGLSWYLLLLGWLAKATFSAWKKGDIPGDVALFFGLFLILWSWTNLFESYVGFWTGEFLMNVVLAGVVSLIWHHHFRKLEPSR